MVDNPFDNWITIEYIEYKVNIIHSDVEKVMDILEIVYFNRFPLDT